MKNSKPFPSLYISVATLIAAAVLQIGCGGKKLEQKLISNDAAVRSRALQKLAALPEKSKVEMAPKLLHYLKDQESRITARASNALVALGPSAVQPLGHALSDPDVFVRLSAAVTLGQIGPASAPSVTALVGALTDNHPLVREEAAFALGQIGSAALEAVPTLKELSQKDQNTAVRNASMEALRKIQKQEDTPTAGKVS